MSSIGRTKRRKMDFKRQQIIERGHKKAEAKAERQKNVTMMNVNVMVDEFDDPTEPLTIYDDYGSGA